MKLYLFLVFLFPLFVEAQNLGSLKIYDHKKLESNNLKVFAENGIISITALKPNVIKVDFSTLPELNLMSKTDNEVYVRVTQNLDDIFMQTDSLLIIINKLDFSIKYKSIKEKLFLVNDFVSINDTDNVLRFKLTNNQKFNDAKGKNQIHKTYKVKHQKLISSSCDYSLLFETKGKDFLNIDKEFNKLTFSTKNKLLGYYFIRDNKNLKNVLKMIN